MDATVDADKLTKLAKSSDTAGSILAELASYERPRPQQDLRRFRWRLNDHGIKVSDDDIAEVFAKLQRLGLGVLIGRKDPDDANRFKWKCNMVEVGRIVAKAVGKPVSDKPVPQVRRAVGPLGADRVRTSYPLRGDIINLELPKDMTKQEAEELADFIRRFGR